MSAGDVVATRVGFHPPKDRSLTSYWTERLGPWSYITSTQETHMPLGKDLYAGLFCECLQSSGQKSGSVSSCLGGDNSY